MGMKREYGVGSCCHEIPLKRLNAFDNRLQKGTTKSTTQVNVSLTLLYISVCYKTGVAEKEALGARVFPWAIIGCSKAQVSGSGLINVAH